MGKIIPQLFLTHLKWNYRANYTLLEIKFKILTLGDSIACLASYMGDFYGTSRKLFVIKKNLSSFFSHFF